MKKRLEHVVTYKPLNTNLNITSTYEGYSKLIFGTSNGLLLLKNQVGFSSIQAHVPSFDSLQSQNINETVNSITSYDCGNNKILIISGAERGITISEIDHNLLENENISNNKENELHCYSELNLESDQIDNNQDHNDSNISHLKDINIRENDTKILNESESNENQPNNNLYGDNILDLDKDDDDDFLNSLISISEKKLAFSLQVSQEIPLRFSEYNPNQKYIDNNSSFRHISLKNIKKDVDVNQESMHMSISQFSCNYNSSHFYDIHSLSLSNHYLMSSDYFTIEICNLLKNMKNTNKNEKNKIFSLNLLNIKPSDFHDIDSVITKCLFVDYDTIACGLSDGNINFIDTRIQEGFIKNSTISIKCEFELFNTIFDIQTDEKLIFTRTVNQISLHDMRKPEKHVLQYDLFQTSKKMISQMKETDSFYEKMRICKFDNQNESFIATGDFKNNLVVINAHNFNLVDKFQGNFLFNEIQVETTCHKCQIWCAREKISCFELL